MESKANFARLKSRKRIGKLFSEGNTLTVYPIRLKWILLPGSSDDQIFFSGIAVPKRKFRKAVDRNRLKRRIRESLRRNEELFFTEEGSSYAFMLIYIAPKEQNFHTINKSIGKIALKWKDALALTG